MPKNLATIDIANVVILSAEKTKNPEQIDIYTVQQKGVRKRVIKTTMGSFWKKDSVIRINNVDDKQETPNIEKDIRAKVTTNTMGYTLRFQFNHNFPKFPNNVNCVMSTPIKSLIP